ncbi:MAG: DUF2806 domain-containing protein [Hyphomicrobiales bacterium]|nr:MAG: DUF2806 domain-containing protein [Hyphomicrobiales bacterium]
MGDIVSYIAAKVPVASQAIYKHVGLRLLGKVVEIGEAWADGHIQAFRDKTAVRSEIAKAATAHAISTGIENPAIWGATADLLITDFTRKFENKAAVFNGALEYAASTKSDSKSGDEEVTPPEPPSEDWMNSFTRYCEDASSEELRDLFAKTLAGEINRKGSFAISTLRVISELTQDMASAFQSVLADTVDGFLLSQEKYSKGNELLWVGHLVDAGFFSASTVHIPSKKTASDDNMSVEYKLRIGRQPFLFAQYVEKRGTQFHLDADPSVQVRMLTVMGSQIASLLEKPDEEVTLRRISQELPYAQLLQSVELHVSDRATETLPLPPVDPRLV